MKNRYEWFNKNVLVLGLARSGVAVAKRLHQLGARVVVNDQKPYTEEANELEKMGITVICGGHPPDLVNSSLDFVVKNPGIPYRIEPIQQAQQLGIPVITEIEIAAEHISSPIVAITGSNGKTTTTTLVGNMLSTAGLQILVSGNIGQPLSEVVEMASTSDWLVAELSSFQLKGTTRFRPHVAAILNLSPAHLDYHETFEDYVQSKEQIFANQTETDMAILNADSELLRILGRKLRSQVIWFSRTTELEQGVFVRNGSIVVCLPNVKQVLIEVDAIPLHGEFNVENVLAAIAIALACRCPIEAITEAIRSFKGVEHRVEFVKRLHDVAYYNDSKATNPQAAIQAISSFRHPVVWIAGGLDRGIDFREMIPALRDHVRGMIAYGQSRDKLLSCGRAAGVKEVLQAEDVAEAVQLANHMAQAGEVVLFSPACASWDRYTSFEERGSIFKQAVHNL